MIHPQEVPIETFLGDFSHNYALITATWELSNGVLLAWNVCRILSKIHPQEVSIETFLDDFSHNYAFMTAR